MQEQNSINTLRTAIIQSQLSSDFGKIRTFKVEDKSLYYAGDLELINGPFMSLLKGHNPTRGMDRFIDLYLKEMVTNEYSFIFSGLTSTQCAFAKRILNLGGKVVFLLHSGIKKEPILQSLVKDVKEGNVLIISGSLHGQKQPNDEMNALFAYLVRAVLIVDCYSQYNPRLAQWSGDIFPLAHMLHQQERPMFIPPWRDEHPLAHLVLQQKYGAQQLPDVEDARTAFAPISLLS